MVLFQVIVDPSFDSNFPEVILIKHHEDLFFFTSSIEASIFWHQIILQFIEVFNQLFPSY